MPQNNFRARLLCLYKGGTDGAVVVQQGVPLSQALGRMYLEERSGHKVGHDSVDSKHICRVRVTENAEISRRKMLLNRS
jgi:hypothetical protein